MFADRAKIYIRSGKGGDGHVAFAESFMCPTAARTAETAAAGGDVIFEVDEGLNTLYDYRHKTQIQCPEWGRRRQDAVTVKEGKTSF